MEFQVDPGQTARRESACTAVCNAEGWKQAGAKAALDSDGKTHGVGLYEQAIRGMEHCIPDLPSPSPTAQINTQKTAPARDAAPIGLPRRLSLLSSLLRPSLLL